MRIAIDIREACKPKKAGKGQWTFGLVCTLLQRGVPLELFADGAVPEELRGGDCIVHECREKGFGWHWSVARHVRQSRSSSVYVSPTSYIVPFLLGKRFPVVPVVHDLIAFRGEPHDRKAQWIERMTLRYAAISARLICTVSEATKADLLKRYRFLEPSHVTPVFAGPMRATAPLSMPDDRTILCIATLCPRKNQKRLIEAYALLPQQLREKYQLVLVGARGWRDQDIVDLAKHTSGVRWMDYVDGDTYEKLLSTCTVFALPSLYEGFGMQILDALQRGIPVLASDRGSLREVCGNAAFYVDPEDPASISSGLQTLLSTSRLRLDLRERALPQSKLFSWERTTDLLLSALQAI